MKHRSLLVGWPSADWKIILPMIDEGLLPNLGRLIDSGVISKITSVQPDIAPVVWTSVATGKHPFDHRILGSTEPLANGQGARPVTSLGRSGKALWNILNQSGKKSQIVGWPASHPAEPLNGFVVTDLFPALIEGPQPASWPIFDGAVQPESLRQSLAELRMHPGEISGLELLHFVPMLKDLDSADDPRLRELATIVASTVSIHSASTELLETEPWDFHAVCFSGIDQISRAFMNYHPPRPEFVSEEDYKMYSGVVRAAYSFHDLLLGRLVELAGEDTTVIVLSDQGYHSGNRRHNQPLDEPGAPPDSKEVGVLVINGPGIKQDELIFGSSVLDIVPTILHRYDLPVGRDMAGNVLLQAFEETGQPEYIDSWEDVDGQDGRHPENRRFDPLKVEIDCSPTDDVKLQENRESARYAITSLRLQLAEAYSTAFREGMAVPILEDLWANDPADSRYGYKLMLAYISTGRPDLAHDALERMLQYKKKYSLQAMRDWKALDSRDPDSLTKLERMRKLHLWKQSRTNLSGMAFLRAWILHAEKKSAQALDVIAQADEAKVYNLTGLLKLKADCLCRLNRWGEAETVFHRMLKIQDDNADAYLGLAKLHFEKKQYAEAAEHASNAIGLRYFNPTAHYIYGGSVFRTGNPLRAADALKVAVLQQPHMVGAYQRLFALYAGPLNDPEQAEHFRLQLEIAETEKARFEEQRSEGM